MRTAREILIDKATKYNEGFLSGQFKWIEEAMEEYAEQRNNKTISTKEKETELEENKTVNIIIEHNKCVSARKTYHFNIKIDDDNYFIIVQTDTIYGKEIVTSVFRGTTHWDCQKRLKKAQKKAIERMINLMFEVYV